MTLLVDKILADKKPTESNQPKYLVDRIIQNPSSFQRQPEPISRAVPQIAPRTNILKETFRPSNLIEAGKKLAKGYANIVKKEAKMLGKFAYEIPKSAARAVLSVGLSTPLGKKLGREIRPREDLGEAGAKIIGEEPIKSLPKRFQEAKQDVSALGLSKKGATALAIPAVFGGTLLDLWVGGGNSKTIVKGITDNITKETGIKISQKVSKQISDDVAKTIAPKSFKILTKDAKNTALNTIYKKYAGMAGEAKGYRGATKFFKAEKTKSMDIVENLSTLSTSQMKKDLASSFDMRQYHLGVPENQEFIDQFFKPGTKILQPSFIKSRTRDIVGKLNSFYPDKKLGDTFQQLVDSKLDKSKLTMDDLENVANEVFNNGIKSKATSAIPQDNIKVVQQGINNAVKKESYTQLKNNFLNEVKSNPQKKTGILGKLRQALAPVRDQNPEVKEAFSTWSKKRIVAKELANEEVLKLEIPNKQGLQTILDYEKGKPTVFNQGIKKNFDRLYKEATDRGLDIKFRENYLPQAYTNTREEVQTAMGKFMKDRGVDEQIIKDYLEGIIDLPTTVSTRLKLNPFFTKQRAFPDYKTAMEYGLTPKYTNPAQLLAHYRQELETTTANKEFLTKLIDRGQITPVPTASKTIALNVPFAPQGYFAEPKTAKMLNGIFRDEENLGLAETLVKGVAWTSKKMQELKLSAGVPKTPINFFAIGQFIKHIAAGDIKAAIPFARSFSNKQSAKYFVKNSDTIKKIGNQGIDLGQQVGQYSTLYKNLAEKKSVTKIFGRAWNKIFEEKTFASFMPQLHIETFKQAEKKALKMGMQKEAAQEFAGKVLKNFAGLNENLGRAKVTEDTLSAIFFAPRFREGIIKTLYNTAKVLTPKGIKDPTLYKNRRLLIGMITLFGAYNYANKKATGHYMWENPSGKELDLMIPTNNDNKDIVYLGFMPSFLAFARNMVSGGIALGKGDIETATQKFGSTLSMPLQLTSQLISNQDYFGRQIYKDTDLTRDKIKKMAQYTGLQINHPFIAETIKQATSDKPLYQSISEAMELPFKFSSWDKVQKQEFYEAIDKVKKQKAQELNKFRPVYEKVQQLIDEGKESEARVIVNGLSDSDYEMYKSLKSSDKRRETIKGEVGMMDTVKQVKELIDEGKENEARAIVDALSDEDYRLYRLAKKKIINN